MRLPLLGGSYTSRSVIATAQKCINYFPEINPKSALVPITHYQRPGLKPVKTVGSGPIRAIYRPSTGVGAYVASGREIYRIDESWNATLLGTITPFRTNPVSMIDNGISDIASSQQIMIVDGSSNGWTASLVGAPNFQQIVDSTGAFTGARRVDFMDTFILWNVPGTSRFGSTLSNQIQPFDPLYTAAKTDYPDFLETIIINRHEILLMGTLKSEAWFNNGGALFPFAELPGAFVEHGIVAPYSIAAQDVSTYWLAQNLQGTGMVMRYRGYSTQRISNHALEYAIRQMRLTSRIDDAIGYTYQLDGHVYYVLQFPSGDQTWVYDEAVSDPMLAWHQEAWADGDGVLHRHRGNCAAYINGLNVCGDWQDGTIYEMDPNEYADTVQGDRTPLTCIRTFPQVGAGMLANGLPSEYDGKRLKFNAFIADFEGGASDLAQPPQEISLRWSDDRGRTWGNPVLQGAGAQGEFDIQPVWRDLGIARYRTFELSHSIDGPAALNGAWVDVTVSGT